MVTNYIGLITNKLCQAYIGLLTQLFANLISLYCDCASRKNLYYYRIHVIVYFLHGIIIIIIIIIKDNNFN